MGYRTVAKFGVLLSVILFCIGVGLYGFARLNAADKDKDIDLVSWVPDDCIGVMETDQRKNLRDSHLTHKFSTA